MCGISGYFGKQKIKDHIINRTLDLMRERGPDSQNFWQSSHSNSTVTLLHSRLNIIDLNDRANQPLKIGDDILIFNGEIYNYLELKKILEKKNIKLKTTSDTEVLLWFFKIYGENCVNYFEGMWSFAIYNKQTNKAFLSRDRFGEKPLFYYYDHENFYFGSEIKFIFSLLGKRLPVNKKLISEFLLKGYRFLFKKNQTFFEKVNFLESGHSIVISNNRVIKIYKYYKQKKLRKINDVNEVIKETKTKLVNSMKLRMRSDVPVAFCLSGGVDSASLVSIACKELNIKTKSFSIVDKDSRYDESDNILATIKDTKCDNQMIKLENIDFFEHLRNLIKYHSSPISTISYFVHSLISREASHQGYKVIISGTGADEIFTGYYDHYLYHLSSLLNKESYDQNLKLWEKNIKNTIRNPILRDPKSFSNKLFYEENIRKHVYDSSEKLKNFLKKFKKNQFTEVKKYKNLLRNRMFNELFHEVVPVILYEDDLNSMMNSIENRSPFLDSKLYEFSLSIPTENLIQNGYNKFILRESMKGIVNEKVRTDRQKKGFNASIQSLVDLKDKNFKDQMLDDSSRISEFIDLKKISKIFNIEKLDNSLNKFIFNFINCKIFLDEWS